MAFSNLKYIFLFTIGVLFIPFLAMQFSNAVNWSFLDFVVMGMLVFAVGSLCQLIMRIVGRRCRKPILIVLLLVFLFLWAELAVGVFASPLAGS